MRDRRGGLGRVASGTMANRRGPGWGCRSGAYGRCQSHLRAAQHGPRKCGNPGGPSPEQRKGTPCPAASLWLLLSCLSPTQCPAYSWRCINAGLISRFIHSLFHPVSFFPRFHSIFLIFSPNSYSYFTVFVSLFPPSLPPCHFLPLCIRLFLSLSSVSLIVSPCLCRFPPVLVAPCLSLHLCVSFSASISLSILFL